MRVNKPYKKFSNGRTDPHSRIFTRFSDADRAYLPAQLSMIRNGRTDNFSLKLINGVVNRCRHNVARVLFCGALRDGVPFPTSFWLICPHLCRMAGSLEGENGVADMESFLRSSENTKKSWLEYNISHALLRISLLKVQERSFLSRYKRRLYRALCLGGVGGISFSGGKLHVKCLHLQIASYLGMGYHPASTWLRTNINAWECDDILCAKPQAGLRERNA